MSSPPNQRVHPGIWVRENVLPSGMTVTEAARRLGVGRPALSNFLNGRAALSQQMAERLARTFGADAAALLDRQARYDAETKAGKPPTVTGSSFAPPVTTIRAAEIEAWANCIEARHCLAVLLRWLVHGTGSELSRVRFPGHDAAERKGWDGWVETQAPTAWIPDGDSGWEFGCSKRPGEKADRDFDNRLGVPDAKKKHVTFVFVTPRRWPGKEAWEARKRDLRLWKDVRAYDADDLEEWIERCVPAQVWFAEQLGRPVLGLMSLDRYWRYWAEATDPALPSALFDRAAEEHSDAFRKWLENPSGRRFTIAADSRAEAIAFMACLMDPLADDHELSHRGIVFETSAAVERLASSTPGAFVAIAATREAEQAFQAVPRTLHCVVPVPRNRVSALENDPDITLELLGLKEFLAALETMNFSHDKMARLGRDSGRSLTVLRRRLSPLPEVSQPQWAGAETAKVLAPLSLAGAWNTASEADRKAISRLADCDHERAEAYVAEALVYDDPPAWSVGDYRGVVSRLDSFFATVSYWTPGLLDRFFEVAADVLSERDPALDLPEEEQWMAALYDKERVHSDALRNGLREALVILAVHGARHLDQRLGANVCGRVESVVGSLLRPLDLDRLRSYDADLPDLAEAAPEVFLDAVEADLDSDDPAVLALMRPADSSFLTGGCPRAGLLWALERLAWEPNHYPRVVEALARLSTVELDDNWANTPQSSLRALFHAHLPQTMVPISARIRMLQRLATTHPAVAWPLALSNESHERFGFLIPSQRPAWRGDASAYRDAVPPGEVQDFLRAARSLCLVWHGHDSGKLGDLGDLLSAWEEQEQEHVFRRIEDWEATQPSEDERAALCDRIRVSEQRLGAGNVNLSAALTSLRERLAPKDPVAGNRWLFRSDWDPVHDYCAAHPDVDFDEAEEVIRAQRLAALRYILEMRGLDGVSTLLDTTGANAPVGALLPRLLQTSDERRSFVLRCMDKSTSGEADPHEICLGSFLWDQDPSMIRTLWLDVVSSRRPEIHQRFLQRLPYRHAARLLGEATEATRSEYWREFRPNREFHSRDQKNELIDRLLEANRPHAAFAVVTANWDHIQSSRLKRLLRSVGDAEASAEDLRRVASGLPRAFRSLSGRSDIPEEEKAGLEFKFFESLRHGHHPMRSLARRMAASPDIFVEAIARCFGRKDDGEDPLQLRSGDDEQQRRLARAAFQILEWFDRIPGADDEGSVAPEPLNTWIGEARSQLRQLGRAEIGDLRIGRLLAKAHPIASGVWPRSEICAVIEDVATTDIKDGFVAGRLDSRSVWTRSPEEGGHQERDLASQYRARAASLDLDSPFVARVLREIANHYDHQAVRMDTRGELQRRGVR